MSETTTTRTRDAAVPGPVTVVRGGRSLNAFTGLGFRSRLRNAARSGTGYVIADLSAAESVDPATIGAVTGTARTLSGTGRRFAVVCRHAPALEAFEKAGLVKAGAVHVGGSAAEIAARWAAEPAADRTAAAGLPGDAR